MGIDEIREALGSKDFSTSRGRALADGREINLEPDREQIEAETKGRIDVYIKTVRSLAKEIRHLRAGMTKEELEAIEFIREQMVDLAKKVSNQMIDTLMEEK